MPNPDISAHGVLVTASRGDGRWPEGVSDGLLLPCLDCGERPRFDYHVTDEFWRRWVPGDDERLGVICLPCLDARCFGLGLDEALISVQWLGSGHTVVCSPTLRHRYAEESESA